MNKYYINVCCLVGGLFSPIQKPNKVDDSDFEITFIDMFKHHLGRKPTTKELQKFKTKEEIYVDDGDVTYIFYHETI